MSPIALFVLTFILFGCASATQTVMPSGRQGYSIDCSGSAVSMNRCYEKAAQKCPHGYEIFMKDESGGWLATQTYAGSTSLKGIMVACKDQDKINEAIMSDSKSCMRDEDCKDGRVCATVGGELPGSCAKTGLGL
jgi:hypothetical protein